MRQGFKVATHIYFQFNHLVFRLLPGTINRKIEKNLTIISRNKHATFLIYVDNYMASV